MFKNRKIKSTVATMMAATTIVINSAGAFAAPFGYNNVDALREKAVGEYFASEPLILANAAAVVEGEDAALEKSTVAISEETVYEEVGYNTIKRLNTSLAAGETKVVRNGENGVRAVTYKVKSEDGVEISREVSAETVTKAPVDKIVEYGNGSAADKAPVNVKGLDYKYSIECKATAYDLSPEENGGFGGQSATGVPLEKGVIAVDPKVIPLGSRVYIEALDGSWSYGYAVAADTGGAIKGKRVDLCYRTRKECIQFGVRPCRVYILN